MRVRFSPDAPKVIMKKILRKPKIGILVGKGHKPIVIDKKAHARFVKTMRELMK